MHDYRQPSKPLNPNPGLNSLIRSLRNTKKDLAVQILQAQNANRNTEELEREYKGTTTTLGFLMQRSHQIFAYQQHIRRIEEYDRRMAAGDEYAKEPPPCPVPVPGKPKARQTWLRPKLDTLIAELRDLAAESAEAATDTPSDQQLRDRWQRHDICLRHLEQLQTELDAFHRENFTRTF
jgi:hypothetical protein